METRHDRPPRPCLLRFRIAGLPRFAVAFGLTTAAALTAAVASAALAALSVLFAHTPAAPPLARDLFLSAWIAIPTALAYAGWIALGSTYLRGRGRWIPVVADFFLGGSAGLAGALLPRGHAQSLLGLGLGSAPLGLPAPASFAALFLMAAAFAAAASMRSGR